MHFDFYWCPMFRSETCCQFECSSGDSAFVCLSFSGLGLRLLFCPLCFSRYCRSRFNTSWQKFVPDRSLSHPRIWWLYGCCKMDFRGQGPQFNAGTRNGPLCLPCSPLGLLSIYENPESQSERKTVGISWEPWGWELWASMHRCLTFLDKEPGHVHLFKGLDH